MCVEFLRRLDLPMIEGRRTVKSDRGYKPHTHATFSVGIIDEGTSRVRIGHSQFVVSAGDVLLIPADVVHACNPRPRTPWSYRMFYVDVTWLRRHCPHFQRWSGIDGRITNPIAIRCLGEIERALEEN